MTEAVAAWALRAEERRYLVRVFWLFGAGLGVSALTAIADGTTADGVAFFESGGIKVLVIFLVYTTASITVTFGVAAGMFAGRAVYGYTTKRDLSSVGALCLMGLWGLIVERRSWERSTSIWTSPTCSCGSSPSSASASSPARPPPL